jgi:chromatin segregation and condensation protein Rec8/ScpA/Scc1 (kleisin family)
VERTKEIAKDQKVNEGGKISLTLEILEVIKAGNVQLMQEEPTKVVRI